MRIFNVTLGEIILLVVSLRILTPCMTIIIPEFYICYDGLGTSIPHFACVFCRGQELKTFDTIPPPGMPYKYQFSDDQPPHEGYYTIHYVK